MLLSCQTMAQQNAIAGSYQVLNQHCEDAVKSLMADLMLMSQKLMMAENLETMQQTHGFHHYPQLMAECQFHQMKDGH